MLSWALNAFAVVPESSRQAVMANHLLRIRNASQLVLVCSGREKELKGTAMKNLAILDIQEVGVASGLSIAGDSEGRIAAIGPDNEVDSRMDGCSFERCIDASGMSVVPGLVDAHTPSLGGGQGARVCNEGKELIG